MVPGFREGNIVLSQGLTNEVTDNYTVGKGYFKRSGITFVVL